MAEHYGGISTLRQAGNIFGGKAASPPQVELSAWEQGSLERQKGGKSGYFIELVKKITKYLPGDLARV